MALALTDELKVRVLEALEKLPAASVKAVGELIGAAITAQELKQMAKAGLVEQYEVKEPPIIRFRLARKGWVWLDGHREGKVTTLPEARRPVDGPLTAASDTVKAELSRRIENGDADTPEARAALALEYGVTIHVVNGVYSRHLKRNANGGAGEAHQQSHGTAEGAQTNGSVEAGGRINREKRERLYARFAAGYGKDTESRKQLGQEFGLLSTTVYYHLKRWEKAGRPACGNQAESGLEDRRPAWTEQEGAEFERFLDGALTGGGEASDLPVEQTDAQDQAAGSSPAVPQEAHPSTAPAPTEAEILQALITPTESAAAAMQDLGIEVTRPDQVQMVDAVSGALVQATPEAVELLETATAQGLIETKPAPDHQLPTTAMGLALMKAGIPVPAPSPNPGKPGRRLTCQVCRRPVDSLFWHEDRERGLSGHKECVTAAPKLDDEPDEALPDVGRVYEGAVFSVDGTGSYALVDILQFCRPERKYWLRGKVSREHVLRRGHCDNVRDWLQPGDLVNVLVMRVTPGQGKLKPRMDLSIKRAPAHPHERIRLEEVGPAADAGGMVPVLGLRLPADIVAQFEVKEINEARGLASDLLREHHMAGVHLSEYTERILRNGIAQTTEELEADLRTMASLKPGGPEKDQVERVIGSGPCSPLSPVNPAMELAYAQERIRQLEAELTATKNTLAEFVKANAELAAAEDPERPAASICSTCWRRTDKFAPCEYGQAYAATQIMPDDALYAAHKGARIVFGPRQVEECEFHLGAPEGAARAAGSV